MSPSGITEDSAVCSLNNPVVGQLPVVGKYFNIGPVPMSGSPETVKQMRQEENLGPSMRMVVDFSNFDRSLQNITIGQSMPVAGWRAEAVGAACDGDRFRPARLNVAEMRLVDGLAGRTLSHPEMARAVANDIPEWLEPHLARAFGKDLEHEMAALNTAAPIDLRVNLLKADRETARRALLAEGITAEPTPLSPSGLRLRKRAPLSGLAAFKAGLFDVQDEGSQIAAFIAGARPGIE